MQDDPDREQTWSMHRRLDAAYRAGDVAALKAALGWPEDFPNCSQPAAFALGDVPLASAIPLSPLGFVRTLLELRADPNYEAADGFPSLFAAIDAPRDDRSALLELLLRHGARPDQRGVNDGTALHFAVWRRDLAAVRLLLAHGADPAARTRIDDCSTPLEDALAAGFDEAAALLG
jgi:ankyrin repeat protein